MADSFKTENQFEDANINKKFEGTHIITTDSEAFENLALSVFDMESLSAWANACPDRDLIKVSDAFLEQKDVVDEQGNPVLNEQTGEQEKEPDPTTENSRAVVETILGINKIGETVDPQDGYLNIDAWRTRDRNGEYITIEKFSDWRFEDWHGEIDNEPGAVYDYTRLAFDEFQQKTFVENLIELNRSVLISNIKDPTKKSWSTKEKLREEFITDVMTSKNGFIQWSGDFTLRKKTIEPSNDVMSPSKTGEIDLSGNDKPVFNMYFFSSFDKQDTGRSVTFKNIELVGKRSHYDTGQYEDITDGKVVQVNDPYDPQIEVAGTLDTRYNEFLGKWESGTPQIIAVMTTSLPAAEGVSIDFLEEESVDKILNKDVGQGIVFGSAIPLHMQNVNPRQWAPNYQEYEKDRNFDAYEKSQITVANLSPNVYSRGDMVILNRIEGLWFPIPLNSSGTIEIIPTVYPQWEFMYLTTNIRHHFRLMNGSGFTPSEYEKGFYLKYYDREEPGVPDNYERYDRERYGEFVNIHNEYYQFTSWDFMGDAIGGLRSKKDYDPTIYRTEDQIHFENEESVLTSSAGPSWQRGVNGNALSNTNFFHSASGDEDYNDDILNTYPFFGCVFPDGYSTASFIDKVVADETQQGETGQGSIFSVVPPSYNRTDMICSFPTRGNVLKNHNDVAQLSDNAHQLAGMFYDAESGDSNLSHLPADIALISSPSGKWGWPLSHVKIFDIVEETPSNDLWSETFNEYLFSSGAKFGYQNRYGWIFDKPASIINYPNANGEFEDPEDSREFNPIKSSWELKPIKPTRIQFRPLSRELYTFLERADNFDPKSFEFNPDRSWPEKFYRDKILKRGDDSNRLFQMVSGYESPVSKYAVRRELSHLRPPAGGDLLTEESRSASNEIDNLVGKYGLKYADDIALEYRKFALDGTANGYPYFYWNYGWLENPPKAAGAMGIIGAVATISAQASLSFSTENVHLEDFGVDGGGTSHSLKTGDYDDDATTTLFAKVYKHWPRKQTLYDPRTFVVHHFNEGLEDYHMSDPNANKFQQVWDVWTKQSGVIIEDVPPDFSDVEGRLGHPLEEGYSEPSGWFLKPRQTYSVDVLRPTLWEGGAVNIDRKVYEDSVYNNNSSSKMRSPSHWEINTIRRSKLLPFSYRTRTIGIGGVDEAINEIITEPEGEEPSEVLFNSTDIIITNVGTGYEVDQEFTLSGGSGGGAIFKVAATGADGSITNIQARHPDDRGVGYIPNDFRQELRFNEETQTWVPNGMVWNSGEGPPSSRIRFVPFAGGGKEPTGDGFAAYAVRGTVLWSAILTDEKPAEPLDAKGELELTPQSYPLSQNSTSTFNIVDPDDNHTYDVFLRYHNDISHVTYGVTQSSRSLPNPREQMVTLTIGAQIGAAGVGDSIDFTAPGAGAGGFSNAMGGNDSFFFLGFGGGAGGVGGFFI